MRPMDETGDAVRIITSATTDSSFPPAGIEAGIVRAIAYAVADDDGSVVVIAQFTVRSLTVDESGGSGIGRIPAAACLVLGKRAVGQQIRAGIIRDRRHSRQAQKLHMHGGIAGNRINVGKVNGNLVIADEGLVAVFIRMRMGVDGVSVCGRNIAAAARTVIVAAATESEVGHHFHKDVMVLCLVHVMETDCKVKFTDRIFQVPEGEFLGHAGLCGNQLGLVGNGIHADNLVFAVIMLVAPESAGRAVFAGYELVIEVIVMVGVGVFSCCIILLMIIPVSFIGWDKDENITIMPICGLAHPHLVASYCDIRLWPGRAHVRGPFSGRQIVEIALALIGGMICQSKLIDILRNIQLVTSAKIPASEFYRVVWLEERVNWICLHNIFRRFRQIKDIGGVAQMIRRPVVLKDIPLEVQQVGIVLIPIDIRALGGNGDCRVVIHNIEVGHIF